MMRILWRMFAPASAGTPVVVTGVSLVAPVLVRPIQVRGG